MLKAILVDFGRENGGKLAPKLESKSMLPLKRKNQLNASPLVEISVRRVQVGSPNRSEIDQSLKPKMKCLLASFFVYSGEFWEAKCEGKSSQDRLKTIQKVIQKMCRKMRAPWSVGVAHVRSRAGRRDQIFSP